MKNNIGLAEWSEKALANKYGYIYGMFFDLPVTRKSLDAKAKQYHKQFSDAYYKRSEKWIGQYAGDCIGLMKAYLWEKNGKVLYDSSTDTSANGTFNRATVKGDIQTIPEKRGLLVWYDGHIGVYVGNGDVIEARGVDYGVVKTKLKDRPWTNWLEYPFVKYEKIEYRVLKVTSPQMYGNDVRQVQGIVGAEIDGYYGPKTEALVKVWQGKNGLEVDGRVGAKSWEVINNPCNKETEKLQKKITTLSEQITTLESSNKALTKENERLYGEWQVAKSSLDIEKQKAIHFESENDRLNGKIDEIRSAIKILTTI